MLNIKIDNRNKKKYPKIKFYGYTNDILNELMEVNVYLIGYILNNEKISRKEQMDLIDNYTNDMKNNLYNKFDIEEIAANGTPR